MRVELIYTPGCHRYRSVLNKLETVIAEERLPIPVHVIESDLRSTECPASPTIRIDGHEIGASSAPCMDSLRDVLWRRWKELTELPLFTS